MTTPALPPLFAQVEMAPRDPILGLTETFNADPSPRKVNLGVGVYYSDDGKVPLLECVRIAERQLADKAAPRSYLPIDGVPAYNRAVQELVFGADHAVVRERRTITIQALGGTGGLKVGADFLKRIAPGATAWISDPSWENHRALFESAGFAVKNYAYYQPAARGLHFAAMRASLNEMAPGSIVVLHACCHNPTGVDPDQAQWNEIIALVRSRGLIPFVDIAYQGFGTGIDEDALVVRRFAQTPGPLFVASSFSKSLSLYGERVGALSIVAASADEAQRILSQVKRVVRTNYSNPPTHGGQLAAAILTTPELRVLWERELAAMRERIREMRRQLSERLSAKLPGRDFSFIVEQRGMFSYSGMTRDEVIRLRAEFGVYAIETGRICVAALNSGNIDYAAESIAKILG